MQPTLTNETQAVEMPVQKTCIHCGSEDVVPDFPNALYTTCRENYIKFPIPAWIKAFGIGIGAVVIFSLFSFLGNLQTGIHMERGVRAEKDHRFMTAQHEFEQVLTKVPGHVEAEAHLLIAAYNNQDLETLATTANLLEGKSFDNQELFEQADRVMTLGSQFFPSDSLNAIFEKLEDTSAAVVTAAVEDYYRRNPDDNSACLKLASVAFDKTDYTRADTLLEKIIADDPENIAAITLLSSVKRYQKDAPGALTYIDKLLELNKENVYALSSKARVMVMLNKDDEALKLAKEVDKLDHSFTYNQATLAIVYHYAHKLKERDEIVRKAGNDSAAMAYMQYAVDIINNKEKLRN